MEISERLLKAVDALLAVTEGDEPTTAQIWSAYDYDYVFCEEWCKYPDYKHAKDCPWEELKAARKGMLDEQE